MTDFDVIAATGKSIERMLTACFGAAPVPVPNLTTKAVLCRTEDLKDGGAALTPPALSLFLYRVDYNKAMRAAWSGIASVDGIPHLPLDLHFMITPWASEPEFEHRILGRAMQCLETTPILSGPLLIASAGWAPNDAIQLVLEDTPTEWIMRTFDSLPTDFKLSVPYLARVVRLDGRVPAPAPRVATAITGLVPSSVP